MIKMFFRVESSCRGGDFLHNGTGGEILHDVPPGEILHDAPTGKIVSETFDQYF